jgi:hypothetical protein
VPLCVFSLSKTCRLSLTGVHFAKHCNTTTLHHSVYSSQQQQQQQERQRRTPRAGSHRKRISSLNLNNAFPNGQVSNGDNVSGHVSSHPEALDSLLQRHHTSSGSSGHSSAVHAHKLHQRQQPQQQQQQQQYQHFVSGGNTGVRRRDRYEDPDDTVEHQHTELVGESRWAVQQGR